MRKLTLAIFFLLKLSLSFGQVSAELGKIKSIAEAEALVQHHPQSARLFSINSAMDTAEILLPLYRKKSGFTFRIENDQYKILRVDSVLSFRVSYIYLNGEKLSKYQIDSLRQQIVAAYHSGTGFIELVQQYNMDGNFNGDTNWFQEGMMVPGFEAAVKAHKKNEIFTVDTPEQKWYHVVLKTFDDTYIKSLTILKFRSL